MRLMTRHLLPLLSVLIINLCQLLRKIKTAPSAAEADVFLLKKRAKEKETSKTNALI